MPLLLKYLSVSSAPAETRVDPSGDSGVCTTRSVWPSSSLAHTKEQTCIQYKVKSIQLLHSKFELLHS